MTISSIKHCSTAKHGINRRTFLLGAAALLAPKPALAEGTTPTQFSNVPANFVVTQIRTHFLRPIGVPYQDSICIELVGSNGDRRFVLVDGGVGPTTGQPHEGYVNRYPSTNYTHAEMESMYNHTIAYLTSLGVNNSNVVVYLGSHPHLDHMGCSKELIENYRPCAVYTPEYSDDYLKPDPDEYPNSDDELVSGSNLSDCQYNYDRAVAAAHSVGATLVTSIDSADDASFEIGGILFTIVNWEHDYRDRIGDDRYDSPNYFSWGLLVEGCGRRIFLGADINNYSKGNHESVEQKLVPWIGHVDLFKMCHHGFTGSNCVALMTALSPQIAIHTSRTADFYASCSMVYALGSSMQIYSTYDCNVHGLDAIVVTLSESGLSYNLDGTVTGRVECGYNILFQSGRCVDQTGWIHYGGRHYYCSEINQYGASLFPLGFTTIGGARYSFSENGYALTGWHKIGQTYYFFEADGAGANRMVYYNGTPYYIQDGELKTGWVSYGGHWYYMHSDYTWARNELLELEGDTYGFNDSGQAVANSWLMIGTAYYHFDSQGHLERNTWIFYDGSWYYLGADGAVVTNG